MLIIGLNGSPRPDGNTSYLLEKSLDAAGELGAQTETLYLHEIVEKQEMPFCIACESPCNGACYEGTELEKIYDRVGSADGLLVATPVYFGTISGQLKTFWDKTRRLRRDKKLYNVVGGAISVGAARFGGQETTVKDIHSMMLVQGMIVVGDCYDEKAPGHHGVSAQQPSREDKYALKRAYVLGKRVAQMCLATANIRRGEGSLQR